MQNLWEVRKKKPGSDKQWENVTALEQVISCSAQNEFPC